ncbi:hypothetical protein PHBOTO_001852 [Pseudozyma hubeiensis]|nr:hypothetical protein PHBOTO_001852 [Pseudozyma hubeiensis]
MPHTSPRYRSNRDHSVPIYTLFGCTIPVAQARTWPLPPGSSTLIKSRSSTPRASSDTGQIARAGILSYAASSHIAARILPSAVTFGDIVTTSLQDKLGLLFRALCLSSRRNHIAQHLPLPLIPLRSFVGFVPDLTGHGPPP